MTIAQEIIDRLNQFAPPEYAEPHDPIGWQLGLRTQKVTKIMVTLDVRPEVVTQAIANHCDLILAHHPMMFRPAYNLDLADPQHAMYADLLKHHIGVFAAHSNLDEVPRGMNQWLAEAIGLTTIHDFNLRRYLPNYRLVTFAPKQAVPSIQAALEAVGAGEIGQYKGCSFTTDGYGYFTPQPTAHPAIGTVDQANQVEEVRLETTCTQMNLSAALTALQRVHPYEEPVIDVVSLKPGRPVFLGKIGQLEQPQSVEQLALVLKQRLGLTGLRLVTQNPQKLISRVALIGGDGGKFYPQALAAGAEVFITGDVYYHTAHDMLAQGLSVIDPGHHIESIIKLRLVTLLKEWQQTENWQLDVIAYKGSTDPFTFI